MLLCHESLLGCVVQRIFQECRLCTLCVITFPHISKHTAIVKLSLATQTTNMGAGNACARVHGLFHQPHGVDTVFLRTFLSSHSDPAGPRYLFIFIIKKEKKENKVHLLPFPSLPFLPSLHGLQILRPIEIFRPLRKHLEAFRGAIRFWALAQC